MQFTPCVICGKSTKVYGYTYGACDACAKKAIQLAKGKSCNSH